MPARSGDAQGTHWIPAPVAAAGGVACAIAGAWAAWALLPRAARSANAPAAASEADDAQTSPTSADVAALRRHVESLTAQLEQAQREETRGAAIDTDREGEVASTGSARPRPLCGESGLLEDVTGAVGGTPLVRLDPCRLGVMDCAANVYAKLEFQNPGGSVKDRVAVLIWAAEKG